jgi:hypothetical protein
LLCWRPQAEIIYLSQQKLKASICKQPDGSGVPLQITAGKALHISTTASDISVAKRKCVTASAVTTPL